MYWHVKLSKEVYVHPDIIVLAFSERLKGGLICLWVFFDFEPVAFNGSHDHSPLAKIALIDAAN